ncbi:hypothetical protein [Streptomyces sp. NBC_01445]|uniref:hypothetical protein n=1 Tax=Streptomyces sp. NBC_01445 TaxID=2903869 RepID=UPI003FA34545
MAPAYAVTGTRLAMDVRCAHRCCNGHRATPLVTVLDGHPHALAFLSAIQNTPVTTLGVTRFGQCGTIDDVYRHHGIDVDSIVAAGLDLID